MWKEFPSSNENKQLLLLISKLSNFQRRGNYEEWKSYFSWKCYFDILCHYYSWALSNKIIKLKCTWKRLFDQSLHEWKVIPLQLTDNTFDSNYKFLLNQDFYDSSLHSFPMFYTANFIQQSQKSNFWLYSKLYMWFMWFNKDVQITELVTNPLNSKIFLWKILALLIDCWYNLLILNIAMSSRDILSLTTNYIIDGFRYAILYLMNEKVYLEIMFLALMYTLIIMQLKKLNITFTEWYLILTLKKSNKPKSQVIYHSIPRK